MNRTRETRPAGSRILLADHLGVALGHIHLVVKNVDAQKEFWNCRGHSRDAGMVREGLWRNTWQARRAAGPYRLRLLPSIQRIVSAGDGRLVPTKGRELDHLGFDVRSLDAFEKHLAAQGLQFEAPPRQVPNTQTRVAFLTDPWGTYIEVTERLSPS
jgi:hypothetical protein